MPEKVTIAYRGAKYEIGRGKRYYGIWAAGAQPSDPIDRWPQTGDGWAQAWARFAAIETPGTIAKAETPRAGFTLPFRKRTAAAGEPAGGSAGRPARSAVAAAGLLGLGVVLGLIGLFPSYVKPQSLASQADQLAPHLIYLAAWASSGVLIAISSTSRSYRGARGVWGDGQSPQAGGPRGVGPREEQSTSSSGIMRIGALLGAGVSAVTFGLLLADLGEVISSGSNLLGMGLVLSLLGWLACAAGSVLALTVRPRAGQPSHAVAGGSSAPARPRPADAWPLALVLLAAIGAVAAFVPSWDSFTLTQSASGTVQTITAGNAFSNPGAVIAGDVAVIVAVVAIAALAGLWRPVRHGAVLLAGATVPLAAQAISALVQVSGPATAAQFGISQAQASAVGLTITSGVTPIFWVYCVFVISLVVSSAWMLTVPGYPAMPTVPHSSMPTPPRPSQDHAGDSGDDSDGDAEDDEESSYA